MSVALVTGLPRACSGDMYAAVPMITPCIVGIALSVGELEKVLARPHLRKRLGQSEIQHLHPPFRRHLHVRRLQVAVNDSFLALVRRLQRLGNLLGDRQRFFHRHRPPAATRSRSVSPGTSSITR